MLGALRSVSGPQRTVVFLKEEAEARAWIADHRAQRARR